MIKLYQGFANCQTITPLKIEKLFLCAFIVSTKRLNYIIKIMNSFYPIGSIYLGIQNKCPLSALIPGSHWELVSQDRVLQGSSSAHMAGTTIEPGLPNITGETNQAFRVYGKTATSGTKGAISTQVVDGGSWSSGSEDCAVISFDASLSNSIYGKSSTVQPAAYVINIWLRTA